MKAEHDKLFLKLEEAAAAASQSTGLKINSTNIQELLDLGVLPNFGMPNEPRILEEHSRLLGGRLGTEVDIAAASLRATGVPTGYDFDGHKLLQLSPQLAISFHPEHLSITSLQAFIRALRSRSELLPPRGDWSRTATAIDNGPYIWANDNSNAARWEAEWRIAESREARTTTAESLCVPMLYGSKGRVSSFVVSSVRQNLVEGAPICDLMAGTGLITRHLLSSYSVHANDAALFASRMAASQALDIDQPRAEAILNSMRPPFQENLRAITELFKSALEIEEDFLLGGLSSRRLAEYRDFVSACTRFVPEHKPSANSTVWTSEVDAALRVRVGAHVQGGKRKHNDPPYILTTAYWGNCYFGLRQAAEIDSLRFAVERVVPTRERPLIEAILLAAADACASGPHYAQPPQAKTDSQLKQLIEKRAKSVFGEFELRLSLACKRPLVRHRKLSVTNMQWSEALQHFAKMYGSSQNKGVYVDPPYSRLQYSRYYHVFDTLLRYDYPACQGEGRTSEKEKRFSSNFDCREPTAIDEFRDLFRAVSAIRATLFLSYSTGGTVAIEKLLMLACKHFSRVRVYTVPLRHHSQGVPLQNRGHRLEVMIVAKP